MTKPTVHTIRLDVPADLPPGQHDIPVDPPLHVKGGEWVVCEYQATDNPEVIQQDRLLVPTDTVFESWTIIIKAN